MGTMVEEAILAAVEALKNRDLAASKQIYQRDAEINRRRYEIESDCLTLIATQQPMASDLRVLAAILEIITELERIGDYAKGIARISLLLGDQELVIPGREYDEMAMKVVDMLHRILGTFVDRDPEGARCVTSEDDEVDAMYDHIHRTLLSKMLEDPECTDRANYMIWIGHNLERSADRVTNIAERIVFVVTGEMRELDGTEEECNEPPQ